jgi:cardiolipin synthase
MRWSLCVFAVPIRFAPNMRPLRMDVECMVRAATPVCLRQKHHVSEAIGSSTAQRWWGRLQPKPRSFLASHSFMLSRELIAALTQARRQLPGPVWRQLVARLTESNVNPNAGSIRDATAGLLNRNAAWILSEAFEKSLNATWREISAAMIAVDCLVGENTPKTEIIWTGPANNRFPVRRIDQVLYDLVAEAERRIILATFAANRVHHLCSHLTQAVERGVELTLIVEMEATSEGQLTRDAAAAFQNVPMARTRIYCWPLEKRERNAAGRPGKLHVKCAIVDDVALIGRGVIKSAGQFRAVIQ